ASNGFLPPLIKEKDGHYLNAIHTLEYFDSIKIPSYDAYLPSLSSKNYVRHCCTVCKKYFSTISFLTKHRRFAHTSTWGRRPGKQPRSKSATIEDFSMLSCLLGITDHESIAIAVAL
ncbi:1086_t:CDS:1, partial [Gigaspora margarita]